MTATATRRDLLLLAVAGAIAAVGTSGFPASLYAQADIGEERFLALSKQLTGAAWLDPEAGRRLLGGFLAAGQGPELEALAAEMPEPDASGSLAAALIAAWYSGVYETPDGPLLVDYAGALFWDALPFTKPAGICGGPTDYWAEPPESAQ